MRQAGSLSNEVQARQFADYLLTLGIEAKVDAGGEGWAIWILDENRLSEGRAELAAFRENSGDAKYAEASRAAAALRKQQKAAQEKAARNVVDMSSRWAGPVMRGPRPLTITLIAACVLVAIVSSLGKNMAPVAFLYLSEQRQLRVVTEPVDIDDPKSVEAWIRQGWQRPSTTRSMPEVRQGEIWRLVTPMFLHFGLTHLLFNMYWLWLLGGMVEDRYGSWWLAVFVLLSSVASNLAQNYFVGPNFGGMSGVDYGLLGYVWMKGKFDPASHLFLGQREIFLAMLFFAVGFFGYGGPIANYAHAGGLVVGLAMGYLPSVLKR